jgi:hypothetical protein
MHFFDFAKKAKHPHHSAFSLPCVANLEESLAKAGTRWAWKINTGALLRT